jgi:hypothetical protein
VRVYAETIEQGVSARAWVEVRGATYGATGYTEHDAVQNLQTRLHSERITSDTELLVSDGEYILIEV